MADIEAGYPGAPDAAVAYYWSLRPFRFTRVEWLELRCSVPTRLDASATTLRMRLREEHESTEALLLEFEGVGPISLHTSGAVFVNELTIMSIADRGWEYERYAVDTAGWDQLTFYCRGFSAALVTVDAEFEGDL